MLILWFTSQLYS